MEVAVRVSMEGDAVALKAVGFDVTADRDLHDVSPSEWYSPRGGGWLK
jgi:hypothetical protein